MRIGLVCPYNITKGGGVQEGILAIRDELDSRGHTAKVITPLPRLVDKSAWPDVVFIGTAADIKSPFATTSQISVSLKPEEIEKVLEREQFDVLHFHEPWVPIMSRQLLAKSQSANIATFHARLPDTVVSKTIEAVITPYTKPLLKKIDELTAVSEAAAEYVNTLTDRTISLVPNGIDFKKYNIKKGKSKKGHTILYIGRLEKRKGVRYLLQAVARLKKELPSTNLVIVGDGPQRYRLEQTSKQLGLKNIKFLGFVDDTTKLKLLSEADVFCSPALYGESFGIVLLEAMAVGLPVVAGDNPGYRSVLHGRGQLSLVNSKDTEALARRLKVFLTDKEMRQLWQKWAAENIKQYDYKKVVDAYIKLYKRSLSK